MAAVLAAAAFIPWYASQALVDHDTYIGNPLPLIDWLLVAVALAAIIHPQLARPAAIIGLISVGLAGLLMYGDAAEGVKVQLLPGLPLAVIASAALLAASTQDRRERQPDLAV
jgi:hypothetical protein